MRIMIRKLERKVFQNRILMIVMILVVIGTGVVLANTPGSEGDPIVSLSYIEDTLIPKIQTMIDKSSGAQALSYEIVNVPAGKSVVGGASSEMILRMGKAEIIATEKGGLADVTLGGDLQNGEACPSNHLLIVPMSDGRGVKVTEDAILMIKGSYQLK